MRRVASHRPPMIGHDCISTSSDRRSSRQPATTTVHSAFEISERTLKRIAGVATAAPAGRGFRGRSNQQTVAQAQQAATEAADTAASAVSSGALIAFVALVLGVIAGWFGGRSGVVHPVFADCEALCCCAQSPQESKSGASEGRRISRDVGDGCRGWKEGPNRSADNRFYRNVLTYVIAVRQQMQLSGEWWSMALHFEVAEFGPKKAAGVGGHGGSGF